MYQYHTTIKNQLNQGIIELVDSRDERNLIQYFPHQPVLTLQKTTTKPQIVYDAPAHTNTGVSLNEALLRCSVMLPNVCGILLRWRTGMCW